MEYGSLIPEINFLQYSLYKNVEKIGKLQKDNENIAEQIICKYIEDKTFILRNFAINQIIISNNIDFKEMLEWFKHNYLSQLCTHDVTYHLNYDRNEVDIYLHTNKVAKEFIQKYHINLVKNEKALNQFDKDVKNNTIDGNYYNTMIKNYNDLFNYLKGE